jgi:hypothetical protein
MAKSGPPPSKKKPSRSTASVEQRLAKALSHKPAAETGSLFDQQPQASVGDRVTIGTSDTVYTISRVNHTGTQVDLYLAGTNIERFRVPVSDLNFVERPTPRQPPKPAKPAIDVDEVHEHLLAAQHRSMDQFSGDIAILKKYLKSKGIRSTAIDELDSLCEATEKRWAEAVEAVLDSIK